MRGTCSPGFVVRAEFPAEQVLATPFSRVATESMVPVSHILWSHLWLGIATDAFDRARAFVRAPAKQQARRDAVRPRTRLSQLMSELVARCAPRSAWRCASSAQRPRSAAASGSRRWPRRCASTTSRSPPPSRRRASARARMGVCGIVGYKNDTPVQRRPAPARHDVRLPDGRQRAHPPDQRQPAADRQGCLAMAEFRTGDARAGGSSSSELSSRAAHRQRRCPGVYGRGGEFEEVLRNAFDELVDRVGGGRRRRARCASRRSCPGAAARGERLPEVLPAPRRRRLRLRGRRGARPPSRRARQPPRGLERVPGDDRPGADPGRLLPGLSGDRRARPARRRAASIVDAGGSYVFRHEPSGDPARLQMFHQREIVRLGEPETVADWRERWRDRAVELLRGLGLEADFDVATDPFFGRSGRMLAREPARAGAEVRDPGPDRRPGADRGRLLQLPPGPLREALRASSSPTAARSHTACLGFGLERITLALLRAHGLDLERWPDEVRGGARGRDEHRGHR